MSRTVHLTQYTGLKFESLRNICDLGIKHSTCQLMLYICSLESNDTLYYDKPFSVLQTLKHPFKQYTVKP